VPIETKYDDTPLATGTHKGGTSTELHDPGADFKSCGVWVGAYIENDTDATFSSVLTVTEESITTSNSEYLIESGGSTFYTSDGEVFQVAGEEGITWDYGDTYNIYVTANRGTFISSMGVDASRGWKAEHKSLNDEGWRPEDYDLDRNGEKVFGDGQPE
jgi:hypothetical protein